MSLLGYEIISVEPPLMLGKTVINVPVGGQVAIYRSMLMNSVFPYAQDMDFPMGDIKITGHLTFDYRELLSASNVPQTFAELQNNSNRIYKTSPTSAITNDVVDYTTMNAGFLKIIGVAQGTSSITYVAKAINETSMVQSDDYCTMNGIIEIIVSLVNNQPPSSVNNNTIQAVYNTFTVVTSSAFLLNYADPENDPAKDVRITTLPTAGQLMYMGTFLTSGMLPIDIPVASLNSGALLYFADNTTTVGQTYYNDFGVSDMGSGQFTF